MTISAAITIVTLLATPTPAADSSSAIVAPAVPERVTALVEEAVEVVETRMRKLHLVRPDLIAYPLAHKVYC
jgi:hypothetical protein